MPYRVKWADRGWPKFPGSIEDLSTYLTIWNLFAPLHAVNVTSKFSCMFRYRKISARFYHTGRIKTNLLMEMKGHSLRD